jgi:putative tricarboxylic transport membrane protein
MRKADIGFALMLFVLAVLVAEESLQLNIGWGLNGPQGGFFPFWLAVGLAICCLVILVQALRRTSPTSR